MSFSSWHAAVHAALRLEPRQQSLFLHGVELVGDGFEELGANLVAGHPGSIAAKVGIL
jgi:hypothetical protein